MSEYKLEPCPCCGNAQVRIVVYPKQTNETYIYFTDRFAVQCEYTGDNQGCGLESGHFKSKEEAVDNWNWRPDDWKYVSDGELPDDSTFKQVCVVNISTPFDAIYKSTLGIWENIEGDRVNQRVYCWRELPQLPPVR